MKKLKSSKAEQEKWIVHVTFRPALNSAMPSLLAKMLFCTPV
jgi:hypothetical protein